MVIFAVPDFSAPRKIIQVKEKRLVEHDGFPAHHTLGSAFGSLIAHIDAKAKLVIPPPGIIILHIPVIKNNTALVVPVPETLIVSRNPKFDVHPVRQFYRDLGAKHPAADPPGILCLAVFRHPVMGMIDWCQPIHGNQDFPKNRVFLLYLPHRNGICRNFGCPPVKCRVGSPLFHRDIKAHQLALFIGRDQIFKQNRVAKPFPASIVNLIKFIVIKTFYKREAIFTQVLVHVNIRRREQAAVKHKIGIFPVIFISVINPQHNHIKLPVLIFKLPAASRLAVRDTVCLDIAEKSRCIRNIRIAF